MADYSEQERTEEATQQRREDFRRRGQVAQTRELTSVLLLFGFAGAFALLGSFFLQQIMNSYKMVYDYITPGEMTKDSLFSMMGGLGFSTLLVLGPLFLLSFVFSAGSTLLQVGFLVSEEAISPNFDKINPIEGFKKLFSWRSLIEGAKSLVKLLVIGYAAYYILSGSTDSIPKLVYLAPGEILSYLGEQIFSLLVGIATVLTLIAASDYFIQRYQLEQQMKMTKQEVRDEIKTREGDPLIKARIRKIQKEVAQRRMMADVPKADVIITNPTHIAIALKYAPEKYAAPILLAKGQDYVATRIREMAREHNIPIVENKPLARTMFKTVEVGQVIPRELFAAVAEVLAYVFRLKKKKMLR
jgi:flagellar biosynthesis protein FlhB